jgi:hypothetical protein
MKRRLTGVPPVEELVEVVLSGDRSGAIAGVEIAALDLDHGVLRSQGEALVDGLRDPDLLARDAGHAVVKPHLLDERDVRDQSERCGQRRHQPSPRLLLGETVQQGGKVRTLHFELVLHHRALIAGPMSGHSGTLATIRASHGGCTRPELRLAVRPNLFNHVLHSTDPELMFPFWS